MKREPKKKIELSETERVEKLASYGLTNKEIAEALGYDENTLKRNFEIFLTKGKGDLKKRLKRKQIEVAMKGNVVMLIWLGKQYLGQTEKAVELGEYKIIVERFDVAAGSSVEGVIQSRKKLSTGGEIYKMEGNN